METANDSPLDFEPPLIVSKHCEDELLATDDTDSNAITLNPQLSTINQIFAASRQERGLFKMRDWPLFADPSENPAFFDANCSNSQMNSAFNLT